MSIKLMSLVWDHTELDQSETLVALALADHANDNGLCWPSIATIAAKARLERRMTQYVIKRLEKRGILQISRGTGKGHTSRYRFTLAKGAFIAPLQNKGCNFEHQRVQPIARKGAIAVAPESSLTIKESSEDDFDKYIQEEFRREDEETERIRKEVSKVAMRFSVKGGGKRP